MTIQVLDCTLRDGGYYTQWDFAPTLVEHYLSGVARLPVDIVEIGYLSHPTTGYHGRFHHLTEDDLGSIRKRLRPDQRLGVMIDAKTSDPSRVGALVQRAGGQIDLVRLAVSPAALPQALALAEAIAAEGVAVGFNVMYLSEYADDPSRLAALVPARAALASVALVDSYGSCTPAQVGRATRAITALLPGLPVGFHGHDNLGLAYANTLAAIEAGATIVDATFAGMGRGAGNTRTELFLVHRAAQQGLALDYEALALVMADLEVLRQEHRWGTNLPYMISGAQGLPQRDVMDWLGKNRYSVVSILRALHHEAAGQPDLTALPPLTPASVGGGSMDDLLVIGGGASVEVHLDALARLAGRRRWPVLHANLRQLGLLAAFGERQLVCLAGDAAWRLPPQELLDTVSGFVAPEPPRLAGSLPAGLSRPVCQVRPFLASQPAPALGPVSDIGPLSLALGTALALGARRIHLAGFDGYAQATQAQQALAGETVAMLDAFKRAHPQVEVSSLTPTLYDVPVASVYSLLSA